MALHRMIRHFENQAPFFLAQIFALEQLVPALV
jgi:hypothetical protein